MHLTHSELFELPSLTHIFCVRCLVCCKNFFYKTVGIEDKTKAWITFSVQL